MATVTLQLINLLLYPRNRQRRFQGYIIGDLKVQRCNGANFGGLLFTYYPSSNYFTQTYTLTIRVSTAGVVEVRGQVIGAGTTLPIENAILQLTRIA
jgi:hypothetical protein